MKDMKTAAFGLLLFCYRRLLRTRSMDMVRHSESSGISGKHQIEKAFSEEYVILLTEVLPAGVFS